MLLTEWIDEWMDNRSEKWLKVAEIAYVKW